jgi:cobalamin biosynthesis protein CobD/CbiB
MGIPGALGYRVINTLDAMIGYHGRYEYLGKFAACVDDILNYIPARLSALMIVAAAAILRKNAGRTWITAVQEHRRTASPNAGWTMAAVAGALNVRLEKQGDILRFREYSRSRDNKQFSPSGNDSIVAMGAIMFICRNGVYLCCGRRVG